MDSRHSCTSSRCLCVYPAPGRSREWTVPCASPSAPLSIWPSVVPWASCVADSQLGVMNTSLLDLPVVRLARSDQFVRRPARLLLERAEPVSDRVRAPCPKARLSARSGVAAESGRTGLWGYGIRPTARKPGMVGGMSQYSIQCVAKSVVVLGLNIHSTHSVIGGSETAHSLERRRWSAAQKDISCPDDGNVDLLCNLTVLGCRAAQDVLRRPHECQGRADNPNPPPNWRCG